MNAPSAAESAALADVEPLFSDSWHRVAKLQPRLRSHIKHRWQVQRGETFVMLWDASSDAMVRLNHEAFAFVGRCDGRTSVQHIWDNLASAHPNQDTLTQPEVVRLLVDLHQRGMVQFNVTPDVEALFHLSDRRRRQRRRAFINPLAFRLPLGNPTEWVARIERYARPLMTWPAAWVWLALLLTGALTAAMHASELSLHARLAMGTPGFWLVVWLSFPIVKGLHELSHALWMQRFGVPMRQAGVTLLMLSPVPYVDASGADSLRERHRRALVSAAGIATELALAALAMLVWAAAEPGTVRDLALAVALTGGLSTVLVNGNPLMRFDGYFVFCDLMDLRNLAPRSGRWWAQHLGHVLGGVAPHRPLTPLPREAPWLWLYAPLSWAWRLGLSWFLIRWAGSLSTWVGVLAAIVLMHVNVLRPLSQSWRMWQSEWQTAGAKQRWPRMRVAVLTGLALALITALPLPHATVAQGVVWLPDQARLRAETDGFVVRQHGQDGDQVEAGQLVIELDDPLLQAERANAAAEVAELDVKLFQAEVRSPQDTPGLREQLAVAQATLAQLDERLSHRQVRAQASGVLRLATTQPLTGHFVRRGDPLGFVLTRDTPTVRVALPQKEAEWATRPAQITARLSEAPWQAVPARIVGQVPGTQTQLPSAALGPLGGGPLAVDPSDTEGINAQTPVVVLDLALPANVLSDPDPTTQRYGARVHVRFEHGFSSLAAQAARNLRQVLLSQFRADQ